MIESKKENIGFLTYKELAFHCRTKEENKKIFQKIGF